MRDLAVLFIHLIVTISKLMRPGGVRAVVAESLLVKHQVERLIGTSRREYLDLVPYWNARDLESKMHSFKEFYNDQRCHYALVGDTPSERTGKTRSEVADLNSYRWQSHCRCLYHLPVAA